MREARWQRPRSQYECMFMLSEGVGHNLAACWWPQHLKQCRALLLRLVQALEVRREQLLLLA